MSIEQTPHEQFCAALDKFTEAIQEPIKELKGSERVTAVTKELDKMIESLPEGMVTYEVEDGVHINIFTRYPLTDSEATN